MTDEQLLAFLAEHRKKAMPEQNEGDRAEHSNGLTFRRARALVLNPSGWTEAERVHVAACHRCARLVEGFERDMVHPSWRQLLCHVLRKETEEEARALRYHLEDGECQRCLQLVSALEKTSPGRLADWFARQLQAHPTAEVVDHPGDDPPLPSPVNSLLG